MLSVERVLYFLHYGSARGVDEFCVHWAILYYGFDPTRDSFPRGLTDHAMQCHAMPCHSLDEPRQPSRVVVTLQFTVKPRL